MSTSVDSGSSFVCEPDLGPSPSARRRARRRARRGVTLVEVLIVVSIMALIAGGATLLVFPEWKRARVRAAIVGASTIRQAAQNYMNLDAETELARCPSVDDLVATKKIDKGKTADPWGSTYKVACEDGDVHVSSPGHDRRDNTPDDLRDDTAPEAAAVIAKLD